MRRDGIKQVALIETFFCVNRRAPFWGGHVKRLRRSARRMKFSFGKKIEKQIVRQIHSLKSGAFRGRLELFPAGVFRLEFRPMAASEFCRRNFAGETLLVLPCPKDYPGKFAGMKTNRRAGLERLYRRAVKAGAADAVLHSRGIVMETTRANIFWIKNGVVYTPSLSTGCLPGVMRGFVIRLLRSAGVTVRTGRFDRREMMSADVAFRTNAVIGIRGVSKIGDNAF